MLQCSNYQLKVDTVHDIFKNWWADRSEQSLAATHSRRVIGLSAQVSET